MFQSKTIRDDQVLIDKQVEAVIHDLNDYILQAWS